jgi:hypothetical protein
VTSQPHWLDWGFGPEHDPEQRLSHYARSKEATRHCPKTIVQEGQSTKETPFLPFVEKLKKHMELTTSHAVILFEHLIALPHANNLPRDIPGSHIKRFVRRHGFEADDVRLVNAIGLAYVMELSPDEAFHLQPCNESTLILCI